MGFICVAGHFIGVNLAIPWDEQWLTTCYCGKATFPVIDCTKMEWVSRYEHYKRLAADARLAAQELPTLTE